MDTYVGSVSHIVNLTIVTKDFKQLELNLEAAVEPKVTCDLPLVGATHFKNLPDLKNLKLADIFSFNVAKLTCY